MKRLVFALAATAMILSAPACWALSEADEAGIGSLIESTVSALTTGEPALSTLFSTQGSVAVIVHDGGFTAASRGKLKTSTEISEKFRLPEDAVLASKSLYRVGDFILGRAQVSMQVAVQCEAEVAGARPLNDLWGAFHWKDRDRKVGRTKPAAEPVEKSVDRTVELAVSAVRDGPERSWRYISLAIMPAPEEADPAGTGAVIDTLRAWERSLMSGELTELSQSLHDDPFCVAVATPDGQTWFFTYPEYLTTMLATALAMGSADESAMVDLDTVISGDVASIMGTWQLEIPMIGAMDLGLASLLVKIDGQWKLMGLTGGLAD